MSNFWITISTNTTIIPLNGSITLTVRTSHTGDDIIPLYLNDVKVRDNINPDYVNPFTYTYTFDTKGVYNVQCYFKGQPSNVLTIYVDCDYAIVFDEDFYTTCNGSATVKACLTESDVPLSGETISLTGTGSTLTATTDSDGVATFNLTGISESKTLSASYGYESSDVTLFYFDTSTEFGSLYCVGSKLVKNLKAKGISGISFLDGLTTLVNEIPNIEPSIGGIVLDTALSCSASSNSVFVGDTVTFSGKLSCSFDDTQQTNDDMEGYIKTALIEIYDGNTLLGSTSTDSNGEYSYTYTTTTAGTMSIVASYDGTDYYEDCVSSAVSVVVNSVTPVADSISMTADKSILSYADSESATLSATVLDQFDAPMENETVEFFNGSTSMGTATTNASGIATKSYSSTGAGDINFTAEVGSLVSEIYELEDCKKYISTYSKSNGSSVTWDTPFYQTGSSDCEISFKMKTTSNSGFLAMNWGKTSNDSPYSIRPMIAFGKKQTSLYDSSGTETSYAFNDPISTNTDVAILIQRQGTSLTVKMDDVTYVSDTVSYADQFNYLTFLLYATQTGTITDLKVKPL